MFIKRLFKFILLAMEAAVHVQSADEYDKAATVNSSADPVGQGGPVEQEAVYCDTATTPDNITESFDTHQSPLQKLPVTAAAISPYDIAPLPHAPQRGLGKQKRKSQSATVLTSTPHKDYLNGLPAKKPKPSKRLVFSVPSSEAKRATKKTKKADKKTKKCLPRANKPTVSSSVDKTPCCICTKRFDQPPADSWTQCPLCTQWYHDSCGPEDTVVCYLCLA